MGFIYNSVIDEVMGESLVEKYRYDMPFLCVYLKEEEAPHFFIFSEQPIHDLKNIELFRLNDYGVVRFHVGYNPSSDVFKESESVGIEPILDDQDRAGVQLEYKVSLDNLNLLERYNGERASVLRYSVSDYNALEELVRNWFSYEYDEEIENSVEKNELFNTPENKQELKEKTIDIALNQCLSNNVITYWDAFKVPSLFEDGTNLTGGESQCIEFCECIDFVPIING